MSASSLITRGLKRMEVHQSSRSGSRPKFKFNNVWYDCVTSTMRRGDEITIGQRVAIIDITLLVRKEVLPKGLTMDSELIFMDDETVTMDSDDTGVPVTVGKKIAHRGRELRVIRIDQDSFDTHYTLHCEDPNR